MSKTLGKIKFLEGRIITNKNGVIETWSTGAGDSTIFITHNGTNYRLLNGKESKNKYQEFEEDFNDDDYE